MEAILEQLNQVAEAMNEGEAGERARQALTPMQAVLLRARHGDQTSIPVLEKILNTEPSIWRDCYNLVASTEQAWLKQFAGVDLLISQSIRRSLEQLKQDLRGSSSTPLDDLLIDRIAVCWLALQYAATAEASRHGGDGEKVAKLRLKQLESANRQFLAAIKSLAVVRRLAGGLKVEITHHAVPAAIRRPATGMPGEGTGDAPEGAAAVDPNLDATRDRLNGLFKSGIAQETAVVG